MRIEAVTVCVDYSDFLAEVIPHNLPHLDDWTIVTSPDDRATQNLCDVWGLRCLKTEVFWRDGPDARGVAGPLPGGGRVARFNKSRGIAHGLNHCTRSDWLLHLDADMVLPARTRQLLANAELQEDTIYGADRVNCPGYAEWKRYAAELPRQRHYFIGPPGGWPLATRLIHQDYGGWLPIGFFQLWHASRRLRYPILQDAGAEHTDVLHAAEWSRPRRALLPELLLIHLQTAAAQGTNWRGRRSPPFGPGPCTEGPDIPSPCKQPPYCGD